MQKSEIIVQGMIACHSVVHVCGSQSRAHPDSKLHDLVSDTSDPENKRFFIRVESLPVTSH